MATEDVRAALTRAERRKERIDWDDPEPGYPKIVEGVEIHPGEWNPDIFGMPPDCPVQPIGCDDRSIFVQDQLGQFIELPRKELGQTMIQALFGERQNYLYWAWPSFGKRTRKGEPPPLEHWKAERVRETLFIATARRGPFNKTDRVRGLGAWRGRHGDLVWNAGSRLYRSSATVKRRDGSLDYKPLETGMVDGYFYTRRPDILEPWPEPVAGKRNPAREILAALRRWNWERPEVDPVLFLGFIAASMLGGALGWRPSVFLIAGEGSGKSALQDFVESIAGEALVHAADASPASIYQHVKNDSLLVCVDELEAEADNRKALGVVKQARIAASGGLILRGGADGKGIEFKARSCFFFSAVNAPPLEPADYSRFAVLRMRPVDKHAGAAPTVDAETTGAMLLRRLFDEWGRLDAARDAYAAILAKGAHDKRGQDTFGTLLACADLALGADAAAELGVPIVGAGGDWWAEALPPPEDRGANWRRCLEFMLSSPIEQWRNGARPTIGRWVRDLQEADEKGSGVEFEEVATQIKAAGLLLLPKGTVEGATLADGYVLAVPINSQLLARVFKDSKWAGAPGVGGWANALRQAPLEILCGTRKNKFYFDGVQQRCVLVKLGAYWKMGE